MNIIKFQFDWLLSINQVDQGNKKNEFIGHFILDLVQIIQQYNREYRQPLMNNKDHLFEQPMFMKTQNSWWRKILKNICSCFKKKQKNEQKYNTNLVSQSGQGEPTFLEQTKTEELKFQNQIQNYNQQKKKKVKKNQIENENNLTLSQLIEPNNKKNTLELLFVRRFSNQESINLFQIAAYKDSELIAVGTYPNKKILVKLFTKRLKPPVQLVQKSKSTLEKQKNKHSISNPKLQEFWSKRYLIFQKFDSGIQIDQQSWYSVIPQVVALHIAKKIQCQVVLDAFSGVGCISLKLANYCSRVIANDESAIKLDHLNTNAKIYGIQNIETSNKRFLQIKEVIADLVFIAPPLNQNFNQAQYLDFDTGFVPSISQILQKALTISRNIILLLPYNIEFNKFCSLFSSILEKADYKVHSCSIYVQKIYFMQKLKYLCIYYGTQINHEIKLGDELDYIYILLKDGKEGIFEHKKVIKQIRERYGMINLLNFVYESQNIQNNQTAITKFYQYIKIKKLIDLDKLNLLISYQKNQFKKIHQRMSSDLNTNDNNQEVHSQQTHSYITNQTTNSGIVPKKSQRIIEIYLNPKECAVNQVDDQMQINNNDSPLK